MLRALQFLIGGRRVTLLMPGSKVYCTATKKYFNFWRIIESFIKKEIFNYALSVYCSIISPGRPHRA